MDPEVLRQLAALDADALEQALRQSVQQAGATERALAGELVRRARDRDGWLDAYVRQGARAARLQRVLELYVRDHERKRWPDERPCPCWMCVEARKVLGGEGFPPPRS